MELKEVKSSNIKKLGYKDKDLFVEYMSGSQYKYKDVPKNLYEDLLKSESIGKFVNSQIKNKFKFEKVA